MNTTMNKIEYQAKWDKFLHDANAIEVIPDWCLKVWLMLAKCLDDPDGIYETTVNKIGKDLFMSKMQGKIFLDMIEGPFFNVDLSNDLEKVSISIDKEEIRWGLANN